MISSRSDLDLKEAYAAGSLTSYSDIFEAYTHETIVSCRRKLLTFGTKHRPCNTCSENDIPGTESEIARRSKLYKVLVSKPGSITGKIKSILLPDENRTSSRSLDDKLSDKS